MSRWLSAAGFSALLVAIVGAQGQSPGLSPADQARLYQRNKQLVRAAVESSLELSEKKADFNGYLDRADICTNLAKRWAAEVESAAKSNDLSRTKEMTGLLDRVIDLGVAANIKMARQGVEVGSQNEKDLFLRRDAAIKLLKPLEAIEPARPSVQASIEKLEGAAKK